MTIWHGCPLAVLNEDCMTFTISKSSNSNIFTFLYHLKELNGWLKNKSHIQKILKSYLKDLDNQKIVLKLADQSKSQTGTRVTMEISAALTINLKGLLVDHRTFI